MPAIPPQSRALLQRLTSRSRSAPPPEYWRLVARRLQAICLLGVFIIPGHGVLDWIQYHWFGGTMPLGQALAIRLGASVYYLLLYLLLRNPLLGPRALQAVEWAMFPLSGVIGSYLGLRGEGIDTTYYAGAALVIVARGFYVPGRLVQVALTSTAVWLTYPLTVLAGAAFLPEVVVQFGDPQRLAGFAVNNLFLLTFLVLSLIGAALVNRLQLRDFRLQRIGRYEILGKLGAGGMGTVYLARHGTLKRSCAIKVMRHRDELTAADRARFVREARATSRLDHPNTIHIFDFGESQDGALFYAMEHVDGLDLRALVSRFGPQSPARAVHLALQVCRSLEQAHARGIVHRDMKPENVLTGGRGGEPDFVKVFDFGLAKILAPGASSSSLSRTGAILGTPHYMAPEQCTGRDVDARADLYGVGCVLSFVLTGRPVFEGKSALDLIIKHANEPPAPPSSRNPAVPPDLDAIVLRCMEKRPDDRYPNARALHDALMACSVAGAWTREDARDWWLKNGPAPFTESTPSADTGDVVALADTQAALRETAGPALAFGIAPEPLDGHGEQGGPGGPDDPVDEASLTLVPRL